MSFRAQNHCIGLLSAAVVSLLAVGCTKSSDAGGGGQGSSPQAGGLSVPAGNDQTLDIVFSSSPEPVRSGSNTLTVTVKRPDGTTIDDAAVSAQFYMPGMPSMNMPEMRSEFAFTPKGRGLYEASGELVMGGTWNVTIDVRPAIGSAETRTFSIVAK